ncbi:xanthine dehydrogenase accessory factor [Pseudosulfitobacter pseudonitzschiae]|uniref:XdhC/CoxI family protein n=1 Tax=Pseudosulfitobacter pseudonitzschiae TaxID=1402135 RepID=A0A073J7R6_9RHOB|nr:XdhC family protein [Pseudosulfitobacter pseudonitzschiae]KEJ97850.1 XdhC/CoxI family protein [Pseudosulfitobacter pseudonitzschiae]QKS09109.1 XdhC family protein [Pseudosulfitobacter pseudonitzschiae]SHE55793.1 xanthine dehydrogenase accessory factor [Pseudosulfitobacter pseudonitzschiae]
MDIFENAPELALDWHRAGRGAALATVVETWGSAPRRTGAMLVVSGDGEMMGSVSGGCVEGAVVMEAQDALADGKPRLLEYGVSDGDAFAVGLACGGNIRILVEPVGAALDESVLEQIVQARAARRPVAYVVNTADWSRSVVAEGHESRFAMDRSGLEEDGSTFVHIHNPPLRLIVVGAVHIAQALLPMARIAGYDPVVIDPRGAFGSQARFPGETILDDWPDEALDNVGLDARTALVLLTHDPKLDDPALHRALNSKAFYIGALGSKRTHASRVARLQEAGFDDTAIARIKGPVGLDIGAASPPEIAVSILAQMVQALRRGA